MLLLFKSLINFNFKYDNIVNFKNLINIVLQATNLPFILSETKNAKGERFCMGLL